MPKQYEVISRTRVLGHKTGEKFHADLDPEHEARMIRGGFLAVVEKPARAPAPAAADTSEEEE
jgi:hypothetical protein